MVENNVVDNNNVVNDYTADNADQDCHVNRDTLDNEFTNVSCKDTNDDKNDNSTEVIKDDGSDDNSGDDSNDNRDDTSDDDSDDNSDDECDVEPCCSIRHKNCDIILNYRRAKYTALTPIDEKFNKAINSK